MPAIETIIVGGGARGNVYGKFALEYPHELNVIGVAEPDENRRNRLVSLHDVAPNMQFDGWEAVTDKGEKLAPTVMNCTMDRQHYESTLKLLDLGYDVLLEKPMSPLLHENIKLVQKAEDAGRLLQVCHVLRYTPFWEAVRQVVQAGKLGNVVSVTHHENLHYMHMAHSFVRGNWREYESSGPMILSKCCHDLDILLWILKKDVVYLNSFGSLTHFKPENAPEGATLRCTDGCPVADICKYDAVRGYVDGGYFANSKHLMFSSDKEERLENLKKSWYSRCVYHCDNDVVDHQTVNMEMEDGTTVTLTMNGQGEEEGRTMRWDGTKATLFGEFNESGHKITIHHHLTGEIEDVPVIARDSSGHGGGDFGIVRSFVNAVNGTPDDSITTARESLESHLLAFAAEESRINHTTIYMPEYRKRVDAEARQMEI